MNPVRTSMIYVYLGFITCLFGLNVIPIHPHSRKSNRQQSTLLSTYFHVHVLANLKVAFIFGFKIIVPDEGWLIIHLKH